MRYFVFMLLFTLFTPIRSFFLQAESAQWYCHQVPSEWDEEQIKICGVGEAPKEEEARKLALENTEKVFQTLCSQNSHCHSSNYKMGPERMECHQLEDKNIWKCYRLIEKIKITSPSSVGADFKKLPTFKNNILLAFGVGTKSKYTLRFQKNFSESKRFALLFSAEYISGNIKKSYVTDYHEIAGSFGILFKLPIFAKTDFWITTGMGGGTYRKNESPKKNLVIAEEKRGMTLKHLPSLTFSIGANFHFYQGNVETPLILQASKNLMMLYEEPVTDYFIGSGVSF